MLRVFRLDGGVVPPFLVQSAALRGRIRHEQFRGLRDVLLCAADGEIYARGLHFDDETAERFLAGTFDFAKALPPRRGCEFERMDWLEYLLDIGREWTALDRLISDFVGPELEDRIPDLQAADLGECKSWMYPRALFDESGQWWSVGLAGTHEQLLLFRGADRQLNWHSEGWHIPGIGPPRSRSPRKPYPFDTVTIREVYTWLMQDEECAHWDRDTILPDRLPQE